MSLSSLLTKIYHSAPSAFLPDIYWDTWSSHPIVKVGGNWRRYVLTADDYLQSVTDVMSLVNSLCFMLSHTPFQQENYSRLIIGIIVRYYVRCSMSFGGMSMISLHPFISARSDSFRVELVTVGSFTAGELPLAATWAQRDEIVACLEALQSTPVSDCLPKSACSCSAEGFRLTTISYRIKSRVGIFYARRRGSSSTYIPANPSRKRIS